MDPQVTIRIIDLAWQLTDEYKTPEGKSISGKERIPVFNGIYKELFKTINAMPEGTNSGKIHKFER